MTIQKWIVGSCTLWAEAQVFPRLFVSQCDPHSTAFHSGPPFVPICRNKDDLESHSKSGGALAATITYPGGKGPLFMGVILGAGVTTDAEEAGSDLGPVAACEEPAAAAAAAVAETPGSSWWLEPPAADAREDPSEAGPSVSSLGEELLEEPKDGNVGWIWRVWRYVGKAFQACWK